MSGASTSSVARETAAVTTCRELGARSGFPIDRRLRGATTGRHRSEQPAGEIRAAKRAELAVRCRPRLPRRRKRARSGNALRKAHERDAGRRRPQDPDELELWTNQRGKTARHCADRGDARLTQVERRRRANRQTQREERRGCARREVLDREDQDDHRDGHQERRDRRRRKLLDDRQHVAEESGLDDVNAKQFRNLIHHDDQTDGGFEPGQHRLGDEVGDEAKTKRACQQEQAPTSIASVAAAGINSAPDPFGAATPSAVALRIAIVVVVLTLSGRDVPSAA